MPYEDNSVARLIWARSNMGTPFAGHKTTKSAFITALLSKNISLHIGEFELLPQQMLFLISFSAS